MKIAKQRFFLGVPVGAAIVVAGLGFSGCQGLAPPSEQDHWAHDASVQQIDREWAKDNDGFSGTFSCHTADGGCLHMACTTKKSCDYMQIAEKQCAAPTITDPKVLAKIVVKDDSCESIETQPNSYYMATPVTGTYYSTSGSGWVYPNSAPTPTP